MIYLDKCFWLIIIEMEFRRRRLLSSNIAISKELPMTKKLFVCLDVKEARIILLSVLTIVSEN